MAERRAASEQPHDILAAEAFALGEGDRDLHREPAHDVLAADEFALPAGQRHALPPDYAAAGRGARSGSSLRVAVLGLLGLLWLRRRRRG